VKEKHGYQSKLLASRRLVPLVFAVYPKIYLTSLAFPSTDFSE